MDNKPTYPSNHKAAMRVPKGGSCCANCKFWDGEDCENKYYREWAGTKYIPVDDPETYCSDWYEPRESNSVSIGMNKNLNFKK